MSLFKTENCPICDNKTNAFKKSMAKYNGFYICRPCYLKILSANINYLDIKKKSLEELRTIINNKETDTKKMFFKKQNIDELLNNGYTVDTFTFYPNYFEKKDKYSNIKTKYEYDINNLPTFKIEKVGFEFKGYYNSLNIHILNNSGFSTLEIAHFEKCELENIKKLVNYLNQKIEVWEVYAKEQKELKAKEEYERQYGKHRFSNNKFTYLDNGMYLKYKYYDIQIKGTEYQNFDITKIALNEDLKFEFDINNEYDKNAIKVLYKNETLGYVPKNNIQKMISDYFNDDEKYVEAFVSKVDEDSKLIEMAVGFYKEITDEELKNIPHIDASLTKTSKKDEYGNSRQENLENISEEDEVDIDYQYDTDTYLVTDNYGNELGEINQNKSETIQDYENDGKEFYCTVLELGETDSGNITCKIRIFVIEE